MTVTTQNNRLLSIDLARGLAVLFMIAVHTLEVFASEEVKNSVFGEIIEFLGGPPAAPVFMTLMGFSFINSSKSELKPRLLRGFKLFLSGYILNIIRGVLPFSISTYLNMDIVEKLPLEKLNEYTILTIVDILQFAGIALMIMALIHEFKINKYIILLAAFIISMLSPFLWGFTLNIPLVDQIFELLWGDQAIGFSFIDNKIAFPIFPWLSFPLIGMYLGETMKNTIDQNRTFKHFGIGGIVVLLIGIVISYNNIEYHFNDYYHSRQGAMLFMCGFVVFWIYITKIAIDKLPANKLFELLFKWSKGVTNIYFAQWIIIIWSIAFFGINESSYTEIFLLVFLFTFVSHFINEFMIYIKNKIKQGESEYIK
ncbi:MAG: heparan-alpha-glucosaminide N-acetyltransferase domain-containing protein [Bacteroidota bacterium]|jgi:uncharacterized membrane protein